MIITKRKSLKSGPMDAGFLAPLIAEFEASLRVLGHSPLIIRGYTDSACHFAAWALKAGLPLHELGADTTECFSSHHCQCVRIRRWNSVSAKYARRADRFVAFLADRDLGNRTVLGGCLTLALN